MFCASLPCVTNLQNRTRLDMIRSGFPKFVPENPASASHFPSRIWEILIVSDPVQISQIRHGKSSISQPFSVTNLGNPDLIMSNLVLFCKFVTEGRREGKHKT